MQSEFLLVFTKVPHLLKGRFRYDIRFRLVLFFCRHAHVVLNLVKEIVALSANFIFFTKVPHLLKGRSRHDIRFKLALIFSSHAPVVLNGVKEIVVAKQIFIGFYEGASPAEGQVSA